MSDNAKRRITQMNQQVIQLYQQGLYEEAIGIAGEACEFARQNLGLNQHERATGFCNLAMLYHAMGDYAAAEPLYKQAVMIYRTMPLDEHASLAGSLNNLAALYYSMGEYSASEPVYKEAIEICRLTMGEQHPDFATSLNNLAMVYEAMGDYAAAEPLLLQAMEVRHKSLGEQHPHFAASVNNLAMLYEAMGAYVEAEALFKRSVEICHTSLGEEHPQFAASLNNLAMLHEAMGDYAAAEPLLRRALGIRRRALGEEHPDFATSLNSLAMLYYSRGDYLSAEPLCQEVVEIRRKTLGDQHPDFAGTLSNLAMICQARGDYAAAEPLYKRAIELQRKALGEEHPHFAASLNNLARLNEAVGNYAAAEPLYRQSLEICRKVLGERHPDFATSLNNLGMLYYLMSDYLSSESLLRQATEVYRGAVGEQHPDFAGSLNNQAMVRRVMGDYAAAERLYKRALEIQRAALGSQHPEFALTLNNLAQLYHSMRDYVSAEPLYRQSLEICRVTLGELHPEVAASLNSLAAHYQAVGDYSAAEPLYRRSIEICGAIAGERPIDLIISLYGLGRLCAATDRDTEAMHMMEQATTIADRMIGQIFSIGSESQRAAYLKTVEEHSAAFLSLVSQHLSDSAAAIHAGLELVLRRKAIGAEALAAQRDAVLGGEYPSLEPKLRELTTLRMQIAKKTLAGPGPESWLSHQHLLTEWNSEKEQLESELARQIPEMNLERKLRTADRQAVALALPEKATLVEFVRFDVFDFVAVPARGESQWKPARYLAFILRQEEPDNVRMIDLKEAEPIDRMIATFRWSITGEAEVRGTRDLGALPRESGEPGIACGTVLREALFDPLLFAIGDCTRLLLAPDADLTRVPFEVLPTDDGRRLVDEYQMSYLGAGRDVLRFGAASSGEPAEPVVAADPDFDLGGRNQAQGTKVSGGAIVQGRVSRDLDSSMHFNRLPGTHDEGARIAEMLDAQPWMGDRALEGRLKACRSPRILHLATHGFFLADVPGDPNKEPRHLAAMGPKAGRGLGRLSGPGMENPLLRSGLALAGANTFLQHGTLPAEAEDGILTAEDVSGLDLLATELVVLSACETGLGEVRTGEGVFGLRRAFLLAGAKTLVMSLWKVPDEQTRELMEDFYRRILAGGSRAESLREAQLAMKQKYPDPFYWGAFICQGEYGPLSEHGIAKGEPV